MGIYAYQQNNFFLIIGDERLKRLRFQEGA